MLNVSSSVDDRLQMLVGVAVVVHLKSHIIKHYLIDCVERDVNSSSSVSEPKKSVWFLTEN